MVTDLCNRETREVQLEALFHDAGETYVGDWIRPLATVMEPKLTDLRKRIQATCYQAAGLTIAPSETAPAMAEADELMQRFELQVTDVGVIDGRGDFGKVLNIWFEGIKELRDYEVNNLVLVLDGTRFLFRNADAGGYQLRQWQNTSLNWSLGQMVDVQILDEPGAREQQVLPPLTASFENLPASHDGSSPFTFRLSFSAEVTIEPASMRDHALLVSDGTVTGASRVDGRKDLWEFTVQPAGNGAVSILVPFDRACTETGALCTADGRKLSTGVPAQVVPGPTQNQQQAVALTGSFEDVPAEHDGSSEFTMRVRFSEALAAGSARGRVGRTLSATGGAVQRVRRVDQRRDLFEIRIQPSGHGAVTVSLPSSASCDIPDALCTADGRPLSNALSVLVQGPPSLSVADAEVEEGPNASLAFVVTLGRAASGTVTVGYATADGSATAGSDYTATSGTLSFAAGVTEKTVSVPVIDDSHDEGDETLTLTLSNASGAWIEDGSATGTIENHDPLPSAFIARFGRATAEQVVQHVEERMTAPRERGFRARFAGRGSGPAWSGTSRSASCRGSGSRWARARWAVIRPARALWGAPRWARPRWVRTCPVTESAHRAWRAGFRRRAPARSRCRGANHRPGTAAASSARSCRAPACSPTRSSS